MRKHCGVYAVIVKNESILLVKKTRGPYIGLWDLPGGRIEPGESDEDALVREVKEETGIFIQEWIFLEELTYEIPNFHHTGKLYKIKRFDESQINLEIQEEDVGEAAWRDIHESENLSPFATHVLRTCFKPVDQSKLKDKLH